MNTFKNLLSLVTLSLAMTVGAFAQNSITMWQNGLQHWGVNPNETTLTPGNIASAGNFGLLFTQVTDGQSYGEPLVIAGVSVGGVTHNVMYVATQHDSLYAYDADSNTGTNSTYLWHDSFLTPGVTQPLAPGVDPNVGSTDVTVELGITTTPVVDTTNNTIYVTSNVQNISDSTYHQYLHALDLSTGAEKFGGPVEINPTFAGSATHGYAQGQPVLPEGPGTVATSAGGVAGVIPFSEIHEHIRCALTLYNHIVYAAFGSHSDTTPYHGEIIGFNESNLQIVQKFIDTPNGNDGQGGFWAGGASPATNPANGNMLASVANGLFDQNSSPYTTDTNWGESFLKLPTGGTFDVSYSNPLNYFTPYNQQNLTGGDLDVGSGGLCLLPDQTAGPHTHILVGGGKAGVMYVVDRDSMGGYSTTTDHVIQELTEPINPQTISAKNPTGSAFDFFCTPAYFNGNIYYAAAGNALEQHAVAYNAVNGSYISSTAVETTQQFNNKGETPFISANGTTNGIVWVLTGSGLQAYNAANIASNNGAPLVSVGSTTEHNVGCQNAKFSTPVETNGKVYFTGFDSTNTGHIFVCGIFPPVAGAPSAPGSLVATANSSSQVTLNWIDTSPTLSKGFTINRSTSFTGGFTQAGTSSAGVTTFIDTGLTPNTTYYY